MLAAVRVSRLHRGCCAVRNLFGDRPVSRGRVVAVWFGGFTHVVVLTLCWSPYCLVSLRMLVSIELLGINEQEIVDLSRSNTLGPSKQN